MRVDHVVNGASLRPLGDRILVLVEEASATSVGGIFIPELAREKLRRGEVVAVGPGRVHDGDSEPRPVAVQVGQQIMYGRYSGTEVKLNGQLMVLVTEEDVLGTIEADYATRGVAGDGPGDPDLY